MTPSRSWYSMPVRAPQSLLHAVAGLLALVALAATPVQARAQLRSGLASVALVAYSAPAVHLGAAPLVGSLDAAGRSSLEVMTVNTAYRVELRGVGTAPIVLLRQDRAGLVPWDRIQDRLIAPGGAPVLLDIVLSPTL
jgi:hypothetical protein